MRKSVIKTALADKDIKGANQQLLKVFFAPRYVIRKLISISSLSDFRYIS